MRKITLFLLIFCMLPLLIGCFANKPAEIDINSTVQVAVNQAIAPYVERQSGISQTEMDIALNARSTQISADVDRKLEEALNSPEFIQTLRVLAENFLPTPTLAFLSTPTLAIGACTNSYAFISDVTIPDGATITPLTVFTKSWYIQNTGTCTWNANYKLVFDSGDDVGTAKSFSVTTGDRTVKPGESVVVSAGMSVPENLRAYTSYWVLQTPDGEKFSGGAANNVLLSAKFSAARNYNFYENLSSAVCTDKTGLFYCGNSGDDSTRGFAYYSPNPSVESGRTGAQSIVIGVSHAENATTNVSFGPIYVPIGTWLRTSFSCRQAAPNCNVTAKIYIQSDSMPAPVLLEETLEWNDGFEQHWNIRLSDRLYRDNSYKFIFEVSAVGLGDKDDVIIFQMPRLTDIGPIL